MNYTENYHLPQWEETDRIMRVDFNQMCADMEAGLTKTARDAASATSNAASTAAAASSAAMAAAQKAQASADAAMEKAAAAFAFDNLPCVLGSFKSTGEESNVELGFRPSFLIIWATGNNEQSSQAQFVVLTTGAGAGRSVTATATGFRVASNGLSSGLNGSGLVHWYFAFR